MHTAGYKHPAGHPPCPDLATAVLSPLWHFEKGGAMRRNSLGFSIVDFLIIVALLLIVVGMFGPRLAQSRKAKAASATATCATTAARPAR